MDRPPDFIPVIPPVNTTPTVSVTLDPSGPPVPPPPSQQQQQPPPQLTTDVWPPPNEPVKLFVGQVPKNFDEKDLQQYLEPYAPIEGITILRDRTSGLHKGQLKGNSSLLDNILLYM